MWRCFTYLLLPGVSPFIFFIGKSLKDRSNRKCKTVKASRTRRIVYFVTLACPRVVRICIMIPWRLEGTLRGTIVGSFHNPARTPRIRALIEYLLPRVPSNVIPDNRFTPHFSLPTKSPSAARPSIGSRWSRRCTKRRIIFNANTR